MLQVIVMALLAGLVSAIFSAVVAKSKRRDVTGWLLLGLLFNIFALTAIAGLPALTFSQFITCPECEGEVAINGPDRTAAYICCPHCESRIEH